MFSAATRPPVRTFRSRDLAGTLAVLIAGSGLIYTALLRGAPPSGNLAIAGFVVAAVLLIMGFGGGILVDRLAERYPSLVKPRGNVLSALLLLPVLAFGSLFIWWERDRFMTFFEDSGRALLTSVNETVDETIAGLSER